MEETKKNNHLPAIIGLVVIVLLASGAVVLSQQKSDQTDTTTATETSQTQPNTTASETSTPDTATANDASTTNTSGTYKNGTYSANARYSTPESTESIALTVTIQDGKVSDVSVQQTPQDRESREYQQMFADNYKSEVVGKDVASINLSRVAGSSLTSNGFNDALDTIRSQAQA